MVIDELAFYLFFCKGSNLPEMCVHRLCCSCVLVKYMLINTAGICIRDGRCSIGEKSSGLNMSVTLIPDP